MWLWLLLLVLQSAIAACPRGFYGAACDIPGCAPGTTEDNFLQLGGGRAKVGQCDPNMFLSSFSISLWARPSPGFLGPGGLFGHGDRSIDEGLGLGYNSNNDVVLGWGANSVWLTSASVYEWHSYIGIYDANTQNLTLYLDGVSGPSGLRSNVLRYKNVESKLWIGTWYKSNNVEAFLGSIDEVRVFQQSLTAAQITLLQTNQNFPTDRLVLYMPMAAVEDLSPVRQAVALVGGPATVTSPANDSTSLCFPTYFCNPNPCLGEGSACLAASPTTARCDCGPGRLGTNCQTVFNVSTECPPGQALNARGFFDNTSRVEVELCNKPLQLPFSISLWVQPGTDGAVFTYGMGAAKFTFHLGGAIFEWNGVPVRSCINGSAWANYVIIVTTTGVSLYQSGVLVSSLPGTPLPNTTIPVLVLGGEGFTGSMSQVRIYRRAITTNEVLALAGKVAFTDQLYLPDMYLPFLIQDNQYPFYRDPVHEGVLDYSASPSAVRNYNVVVGKQSPTFCRAPMLDVCDPHPCNFGTCIRNGTSSFTCKCFDRFMGPYCNRTAPRMCSGDKQAVDGVGQLGNNSWLTVAGCGLEFTSFTVSAWVYRSLTLDEAPILWSSGGFFFGFRSSPSSQGAYFEFGFGSDFVRVYCSGWAGWKQFTGTFTWTGAGLLELFVDGVKVVDSMGQRVTSVSYAGGSDFRIGATSSTWLQGLLSSVRLFDRRLTNPEIWQLFDTGAVFTGLQLYVPFSTDVEGLGDMSAHGRGASTVQRALTPSSLRNVVVNGDVQISIQAAPLCINVSPCFPDPCGFGACVVAGASYQCLCSPGYSGPKCTVFTDRTTTCLSGVGTTYAVLNQSSVQALRCQDDFSTSNFTFSGWYFVHSFTGSSVVIGTDTAQPALTIAANGMNFGWSSASLRYAACGRYEWVHFAGIYDMSAAQLRLWVNGGLVAQGSSGTPAVDDSSAGWLWVGNNFDGRLSQIRYHARALSNGEINLLFMYNMANDFDQTLRLFLPLTMNGADHSPHHKTVTSDATFSAQYPLCFPTSPCYPNPCNNGACGVDDMEAPVCSCALGYYGANCDMSVNLTSACVPGQNFDAHAVFDGTGSVEVNDCHLDISQGFTIGMFVWRSDLNPGNLFAHTGFQILVQFTGPGLRFTFQSDFIEIPMGCELKHVWLYIVASYDATSNVMKLYMNEVLQGQFQRSSSVSTTWSTFLIGSGFSGFVDDVRFYQRALTSAEVLAVRANLAPQDVKFFLPMGSISSNSSATIAIFDASGDDKFPETLLEVPSLATPRVKTMGNVGVSASSPLCYVDQSNPCFPNPCLNGVCSAPDNTPADPVNDWLFGVTRYSNATFQCHCAPGFYGQMCQYRSNERPCFPGVYTDRYGSFSGSQSYTTDFLGLSLNNHAFAISFFAQVKSDAIGQHAVSDGPNLLFSFGGGQVSFGFGGSNAIFSMGCDVLSEWHHYTGTVTSGFLKLYVDGKLVATQNIGGWYTQGGVSAVQMGSGFVGGMDEIRVQNNIALNDTDVYRQYITGFYTSMQMWVSFGTQQYTGVSNEITGGGSTGNGVVLTHSVPACLELRVIPGSLVPLQSAVANQSLQMISIVNDTLPPIIGFQMTLTQSDSNGMPLPPVSASITRVSYYAVEFGLRVDCVNFGAQAIRGGGGPINVNCTLPNTAANGGAFLQFIVTYCLWPSGVCGDSIPIPEKSPILAYNMTTFMYRFPTINKESLQRIEPNSIPTAHWVADQPVAERFQFTGTNFIPDPTKMRITYGPVSQPDKFPCELILNETTTTKVVFMTSDEGYGVELVFQVNVAGAKAVGTDMYYYPTVPTVTKVTGCSSSSGDSTYDCPTIGGVVVTITGTAFYYDTYFEAYVGSTLCTSPNVTNTTLMTCLLPIGAGLLQNIYVKSLKYFSSNMALVNYAAPRIVSLFGEGCNNSNPTHVTDCPRDGNTTLTIIGTNFGESGAVVLIGTSSCDFAVHDVNQTEVTCTIPAGHQLEQPVLLIVFRGEITTDPVTLSYKQCPQGQYEVSSGNFPCEDCFAGYFSATDGAVGSCTPCVPGRYTIQNASTACVHCDIGRYQNQEGQTFCSKCEAGKFAVATGQSGCTDCSAGKYQAGLDQQSDCAPCQPGRVQPSAGQSSCSPCDAGTTSNTEFKQCLQCESGSVAPLPGELSCSVCPPKSYSSSDSLLCECEVGMYGDFSENHSFADSYDVICSPCPSGAACVYRPVWRSHVPALPGYWHSAPDALHFEPCLFIQHCPGEIVGSNGTGCGPNRGGLLCANCLPKFKSTGGAAPCDACPESAGESWGWSVLFVLILFAALAVVYAIVLRADAEQDKIFNGKEGEVKLSTLPPILSMGDAGVLTTTVVLTEENQRTSRFTSTLKILVGFFQICTSLAIFDDVKLPSYYATFVGWFDIINLDFVPWTSLSCVANFNFFTKTLLTGFIPMLVIGSFTAGFFTWYKCAQARDFSDDPSARKKRKVYRLKFWKLLLFTLFLLYPSVSRSLLRYFVCRSINFESYLLADLTMVCGPGIWLDNLGYTLLFVLAYPIGIPAIFFYLMWRRRKKLRRVNTIQTYSFLYQAYIEKVWFFEEVEMIHKLTMTSILQFFPGKMRFQAGMVVTYMYTTTVLLVSPYVQKKNELLAVICEVEIMLLLLAGNAMSAEGQLPVGSFLDVLLSIVLILATVGAFFFFVATSIHHARQNYWNKKRLHFEKAERIRNGENSISRTSSFMGTSAVTFNDSSDDEDGRKSAQPTRKQQEEMQTALQSTFSEQIVPFWVVFVESIQNIWDHLKSKPFCVKILVCFKRILGPVGAYLSRGWDAFVFACGKCLDALRCNAAGTHCRRLVCASCCKNRGSGKPKQYTSVMLELMLPERRIGRSASEYSIRTRAETTETESSSHNDSSEELSHVGFRPGLSTKEPKKAILKPSRIQPMELEEQLLPPPPPRRTEGPSKPLPGPPPRKPKKPESP